MIRGSPGSGAAVTSPRKGGGGLAAGPAGSAKSGCAEGRPFLLAILATVVLAGALSTTGPIGTNDIGFHLRLGQEIAESGAPPRSDPHSHTCPGAPYPDHEWLSQLGLYGVESAFGVAGLAVLEGVLVGLTLLLVILSVRGPAVLRIALALAVLLLGIEHAEIRPHLLGWVMVGLLSILLDRKRKIPVLLLLVFWANTHASVLLGAGLAGLALLEEAAHRKSPRPLAWAAAVATAPLVNPYGWKVYTLFFEIRRHAGFVGEWKAFGAETPQFWLVAAVVAAALIGILRTRPIRPFDLVRLAVLGILSIQSSRSGVVMTIFLAGSFGRWYGETLSSVPRRVLQVVAIALAAITVLFAGIRIRDGKTLRFDIDHEHLPVAAVRFIQKHDLTGPIFNDYNFGGYLLWKAWPDIPVFVDGRIEVYRGEVLDDYLRVSNAQPGWEETVRRYGITFFIVRPERDVTRALLASGNWDLAYFDYNSAIFVRGDLFPGVRRLQVVSPIGHRDRSRVAEAIDETRYLLEENPSFFGGHKILAFLLLRNGDPAGARDSLRRYLGLHPAGAKIEETRSLIDRLRKEGAWP